MRDSRRRTRCSAAILETTKDVLKLAQQVDNIDLMRRLVQLQGLERHAEIKWRLDGWKDVKSKRREK